METHSGRSNKKQKTESVLKSLFSGSKSAPRKKSIGKKKTVASKLKQGLRERYKKML